MRIFINVLSPTYTTNTFGTINRLTIRKVFLRTQQDACCWVRRYSFLCPTNIYTSKCDQRTSRLEKPRPPIALNINHIAAGTGTTCTCT